MDSRLLIFFIIFSSSISADGGEFVDFYQEEPDQISSKQGTILITKDLQNPITTPRLIEWFVLLGGETDRPSCNPEIWEDDDIGIADNPKTPETPETPDILP